MSKAESYTLENLARNQVVLEIGSQFGHSTIVMATVAKHVISIDWHRGDERSGLVDSFGYFREAIKRHGVQDRVTPIIGRSEVVLPYLASQRFGLIFHDGAHDYANVRTDLDLIHLGADARLAVHDYGRLAGLTRACHEVLGEPQQVVDRLAIYRPKQTQ